MMGVRGYISKQKEKFKDYTVENRKQRIMKETEKIQADNRRQADLSMARQDLSDVGAINKELRASAPSGPSKVQRFGQGLAKVMNNAKQAKKAVGIGIPKVSGSKTLDSSVKSSQYATSNIEHGGNKSGAFTFGPTPKAKPMPKKRPRVIVEL